MSSTDIRNELCKYARKTVTNKLVVGPGGNISAKFEGKMYLSPSGFALDEIEPHQWVEVDIETGEITDIGLRPSSEVLMHLVCLSGKSGYRRYRSYASALLHCIYISGAGAADHVP